MEFGPEIKVDGKRPDYVRDDDQVKFRYFDYGHWSQLEWSACEVDWKFDWLKLPANHPHYTTPTPDERAVAPELVERMVALLKRQVDRLRDRDGVTDDVLEARAIVAALEPVDRVLLEARQVVAGLYEGQGVAHLREQALSGEGDEWFHTKVARAALARGRQLEKEGK